MACQKENKQNFELVVAACSVFARYVVNSALLPMVFAV